MTHADLITLDAAGLQYQIAHARQLLRSRYGAAVNWFCYPSGHYDSTVINAVKSAGFVGSTTVVPGWASRSNDPYRLPRLRVRRRNQRPGAATADRRDPARRPLRRRSYGGGGSA